MGRKTKATPSLGRSLIKDRFGTSHGRKFVDGSMVNHVYILFIVDIIKLLVYKAPHD